MSQSNFLLDSHAGVTNTSISFESDSYLTEQPFREEPGHPPIMEAQSSDVSFD